MGKTVIAPLIAFVFLTLKLIFNIEVSEEIQAQIIDWVSSGVALGFILYGIFKSHKKKEKAE
jgi:hypothetical protein